VDFRKDGARTKYAAVSSATVQRDNMPAVNINPE
jgi:hypothetical protein